MDFLHANTKSLLDSDHADQDYISARDKHVIVIGGGDTGTDCVGTSLRHQCMSLEQFEILSRPPDERPSNNPWPEWPRIYRVDYGQEEAAARFGNDPRTFDIMTEKFVGDADGNVKELHTAQVTWGTDANGRFGPQKVPGTEQVWPADLVLLALGFLGPEDKIVEELELDRDDARTSRPNTASMPPASRAFSALATCAAGKAWWCGRSKRRTRRRQSVRRISDEDDRICRRLKTSGPWLVGCEEQRQNPPLVTIH